jgi:hypothetical protein
LGGVFYFFQTQAFRELNLRPSFSRLYKTSLGTFSFGAAISINYFDFDENTFFGYYPSFGSIQGDVGVHFFTDNFFAGIATLGLFDKAIFRKEEVLDLHFFREHPTNFYTGTIFPVAETIKLKPVALLNYTNLFNIGETVQGPENQSDYFWSFDLQASAIFDDSYVVGLLYGQSRYELEDEFSRFGLSASYLSGNFRLTYGIQQNGRNSSGVELPVSHLISAGYDFFESEDDAPIRFF